MEPPIERKNVEEKPCLVPAERGFSVSYKGRFLYSKYEPDRAIIGAIHAARFLPSTLILAASPVLWLGLPSLLEKLPENSFVLGIEWDKNLHELARTELDKLRSADGLPSPEKEKLSCVALLPFEENDYIVNVLTKDRMPQKSSAARVLPHISTFRRALMLEMSGGARLNKEKYMGSAALAENAVASFWKNRITLTKLGRLYSRNLFRNLGLLPRRIDFRNLRKKVRRPIFVFGAGESLEKTLSSIPKNLLERCLILSVDAGTAALRAHGIKTDVICAVEGQLATERAYIGGCGKDSLIIADISSRPQVTRHTKKAVAYFASRYTDSAFLTSLYEKDFFPPEIPPLGSVGLSAVHIATLLRENTDIPIFVSGLDFSFSPGKTHAKNTSVHITRLSSSNRLNPPENYDAAFRAGAMRVLGKNGIPIFTDTVLESYKKNFSDFFRNTPNLYDCGAQGLPLGITELSNESLRAFLEGLPATESALTENHGTLWNGEDCPAGEKALRIREYLEQEEKALNRIKELLMFGNDVASCSQSIEEELYYLISRREYLFLHFPDGYRCGAENLSFLKRARGQIDFFLKDIKLSLQELNT